jgi:uracil-DNA glycosylase
MQGLLKNRPDIKLLLFGRIANDLGPLLPTHHINRLESEHPYNLSFIHHPEILQFFKPLRLLHPSK